MYTYILLLIIIRQYNGTISVFVEYSDDLLDHGQFLSGVSHLLNSGDKIVTLLAH